MNYVIGVDGGGTKTLALLADMDGREIARGMSGPSNYTAIGFEAACKALETAINIARKDHPDEISAICFGLAGAGRDDDVGRFRFWAVGKFPGIEVKVVNDAEILLAVGSSVGPALALVCGTGSSVYGRTVNGELIRAGGWGYLFGDEGSGYSIGIAALRAVMQAHDGRGPSTLLTELVLHRRGLSSPLELVRSIYGSESPHLEVASLSDLVEQAAGHGDVAAVTILEVAAQELAKCLSVVYPELGVSDFPLVITGRTVLHGEYLKNALHRAYENQGLTFSAIYFVLEPAEGAVRLARMMVIG